MAMTRNNFIKMLLLAPFVPIDKLTVDKNINSIGMVNGGSPFGRLVVKDRKDGETTESIGGCCWEPLPLIPLKFGTIDSVGNKRMLTDEEAEIMKLIRIKYVYYKK